MGFRSALTRATNSYAAEKNLLKDLNANLEGEDIREGLAAVISVKVREPQFEGQTKTKLGNSEIKGIVESLVGDKLRDWFDRNPSVAKTIIMKCVDSARAVCVGWYERYPPISRRIDIAGWPGAH